MSYVSDRASASTSNHSCYKLMEDDSSSFCTTIVTNDTSTDVTDDKNSNNYIKNYGAILQHLDQDHHASSCSSFGASLNLVNAMMGTGIIGLPLALHLCGFWVGLTFSILIAYLTCFTMHITILCGLKTNTVTMVSLCNALIGCVGAHIVNFIIFFHTAGTAVSYYLLLGDTLPGLLALILPADSAPDRKSVILGFGLFCTLPLSLSRSTACFAKWSAMSVVLLMVMLLGVMIRVPYYLADKQEIELEIVPISNSMFKGLAIMSLAFGCSQNLFGVYTSTKNKHPDSWLLTCSMAILMAFIANMVFAVMAYLCFGKEVQANILLNFPEDDAGIRLVKLALGLFMVLTIPLCIHPCREAVMMMFYGMNVKDSDITNRQHYFVTFGVFAVVLYFGVTLTSLGKVFSVIGGFSTTILGFLLPGISYIYLFSGELFFASTTSKQRSIHGASWKLLIISFLSILIASPVMFFSVKDALF